jgi:hypothetical protein
MIGLALARPGSDDPARRSSHADSAGSIPVIRSNSESPSPARFRDQGGNRNWRLSVAVPPTCDTGRADEHPTIPGLFGVVGEVLFEVRQEPHRQCDRADAGRSLELLDQLASAYKRDSALDLDPRPSVRSKSVLRRPISSPQRRDANTANITSIRYRRSMASASVITSRSEAARVLAALRAAAVDRSCAVSPKVSNPVQINDEAPVPPVGQLSDNSAA